MKNTLKKSTVLFIALAVIAMIITGCKKSDSNNGGGNDPTPTPGNYGTVTIGDFSFNIAMGAYGVENDTLSIVLADDMEDPNNIYGIGLPDYSTIPEGTFEYSIQEEQSEASCIGIITADSTLYMCTAGQVTITKAASNYKIVSTGMANTLMGIMLGTEAKNFTVNFEGPLVNETK